MSNITKLDDHHIFVNQVHNRLEIRSDSWQPDIRDWKRCYKNQTQKKQISI